MSIYKSRDTLGNIQKSLSELSDNLEDVYCKIRKECMEELIEDKRKHITQKNEMYDLYQKLENDMTMRLTWIKNKLPWYITKFHKITSTEISLRGTNIFIGVNFGKSYIPSCYVQITPLDIGWKAKDMVFKETE